MNPTLRRMVEDHFHDIAQVVRYALASGVPADDLVVLLLDRGSHVGGSAGPLVFAFERDELNELSHRSAAYFTGLFNGRCANGDPGEVCAACLHLLLGPYRDLVEVPAAPGTLTIVVRRGAEVGVVSRLPGAGRYLN